MEVKKKPSTKKSTKQSKDVLLRYGSLIREYRDKSNLSRNEFCARVDISNTQLSAWESGAAEPRLHSMLKICELLNIPLNELLFNGETINLTTEDLNFIRAFRKLSPSVRRELYLLVCVIGREAESSLSGADLATLGSLSTDPYDEEPLIDDEDDDELLQSESSDEDLPDKSSIPEEPARPEPVQETIPEAITSLTEDDPVQFDAAEDGGPEEEPVKKKRGRPRKHPAPDPTAEKRKRGRPRKVPAQEVPEPVKRKRGRPRKVK